MKIPFDLSEWVKDKTRKVVDENGTEVEIVPIQIAPQFYPFLPKDVDPTTCCTYHLHRPGSDAYPVLGAGVHHNLFIVEDEK